MIKDNSEKKNNINYIMFLTKKTKMLQNEIYDIKTDIKRLETSIENLIKVIEIKVIDRVIEKENNKYSEICILCIFIILVMMVFWYFFFFRFKFD